MELWIEVWNLWMKNSKHLSSKVLYCSETFWSIWQATGMSRLFLNVINSCWHPNIVIRIIQGKSSSITLNIESFLFFKYESFLCLLVFLIKPTCFCNISTSEKILYHRATFLCRWHSYNASSYTKLQTW